MQDSCVHRFTIGQKAFLINSDNPGSPINGCLFVVVRTYDKEMRPQHPRHPPPPGRRNLVAAAEPHYACRLLRTTTSSLQVGEEYTLIDREMHPYCMFSAEMSGHLDIGGSNVNS